jgi:putative CocE/NonD family hydrolase
LRESLRHFDEHLRGEGQPSSDGPVRVYVMGADRWIDLPAWPPPTQSIRLFLHPNGRLQQVEPTEGPPDRYRFDPNDPTPDFGGTSDPKPGSKDNRKLESRSDVLVYTTDALRDDVEIIGTVAADLVVRSSLRHTDFFCRLCDVKPSGKSMNVCDGIIRLTPSNSDRRTDGTIHIKVRLWPTAYRFKEGNRIRLQVSSGSHPRFFRNPGTGEWDAGVSSFLVADQEVFHDLDHPSMVLLPVSAPH